MANEITAFTHDKFAFTPITAETAEIIREELADVGGIQPDVIKMPSGGAVFFEIPSPDGGKPNASNNIDCIVLAHHAVNARWAESKDNTDDAKRPLCFSADGSIGVDTKTGRCEDCKTCPYNQFGSGADGRGKACKNGYELYLQLSGREFPVILRLSPTSIGAWKEYLGRNLVIRGKRPTSVITRITLEKETSNSGDPYSVAQFTKLEDLTAEEAASCKAASESMKKLLSNDAPAALNAQDSRIAIPASAQYGDIPPMPTEHQGANFSDADELPFG